MSTEQTREFHNLCRHYGIRQERTSPLVLLWWFVEEIVFNPFVIIALVLIVLNL